MGSKLTTRPKIGYGLYEMNKGRETESTLSKLFHEIMFYVLFPDWGSALNKQMSKRERVGRSPSTDFKGFRYVLTSTCRPTGELTKERSSEGDL